MQVAVLLIHCIGNCYDILVNCREVIEYTVGIDTGSIVGAIAVVAGTEGSVGGNQVIARLHALYCLIHITSFLPCLYSVISLTLFILSLTLACRPTISPVFILIAEIIVGNQATYISTRNIVLGNSISQPLDNALCLGSNLLGSSGMIFLYVLIGTKSIVVVWLIILQEVIFESFTKCTTETVILFQSALNLFALVDVSLIDSCIISYGSLLYIDRVNSIGKVQNCGSL